MSIRPRGVKCVCVMTRLLNPPSWSAFSSYTIDMLEALETVSLTGALQAVTSSARSVASKFVRSQAASDLVREVRSPATAIGARCLGQSDVPHSLCWCECCSLLTAQRCRHRHGGAVSSIRHDAPTVAFCAPRAYEGVNSWGGLMCRVEPTPTCFPCMCHAT